MIDKHLNENFSLNASRNPCCFNFDKYFFLEQQHFNTKALSLFSDMMLLFSNGYHGNNKSHSRISDVPNCSSIKFHARISATDGNIRD